MEMAYFGITEVVMFHDHENGSVSKLGEGFVAFLFIHLFGNLFFLISCNPQLVMWIGQRREIQTCQKVRHPNVRPWIGGGT